MIFTDQKSMKDFYTLLKPSIFPGGEDPTAPRALDFSGSKGFGASKPSKNPLRSIKSCCNGVASDSQGKRKVMERRKSCAVPEGFFPVAEF